MSSDNTDEYVERPELIYQELIDMARRLYALKSDCRRHGSVVIGIAASPQRFDEASVRSGS